MYCAVLTMMAAVAMVLCPSAQVGVSRVPPVCPCANLASPCALSEQVAHQLKRAVLMALSSQLGYAFNSMIMLGPWFTCIYACLGQSSACWWFCTLCDGCALCRCHVLCGLGLPVAPRSYLVVGVVRVELVGPVVARSLARIGPHHDVTCKAQGWGWPGCLWRRPAGRTRLAAQSCGDHAAGLVAGGVPGRDCGILGGGERVRLGSW